MVKFRILLQVVILLFLFSGCGPAVYKSSGLQDKNSILTTVVSHDTEITDTLDNPNSTPPPIQPDEEKKRSEASMELESNSHGKNTQPQAPIQPTKVQPVLDEALDFCQLSQEFWQKGEFDSAIEALDQAYSLILYVDANDNSKLIRQKEDLRFMISKRILEIYASRNIVVNGNHNEIPLLMNKHVQSEINLFTKGREKKFFIESYKRSGRYRERIVAELKTAGLPEALSWLPLIESGFKVNALSKARALGLWQFIPSTGYKFGLNRDKYIDERLDPVKSTKAAIEYLKELHQIFGDWSTVLAAYNCGEGRVLRVIRGQNINYLDNFWDLYERLPRETARYVPRFLATMHIINNPESYGITLPEADPTLEYETITISKQVHLKDIARNINVPENELKRLNPELRYNILPNDEYSLRVPPKKGEVLLAVIDEIPISTPPRPAYTYHRVKSGETLSTIARRYRTSVKKIMYANNLRRSNYIVAGKKLKIPLRGTVSYTPKKIKAGLPEKASRYVVKSGDSLWIIAKRFGTTTKKIQALNNLSSTNLKIEQVLRIPDYDDVQRSPNGSQGIYTVKKGDSPYLIAQKHNMPLSRFLRLNRLTPRCKIYPGQQLSVD